MQICVKMLFYHVLQFLDKVPCYIRLEVLFYTFRPEIAEMTDLPFNLDNLPKLASGD